MTVIYTITEELRIKLKEPFGQLIKGTFEETKNEVLKVAEENNPPKVVTVGDTVSRNLHATKLCDRLLAIIDHKTKRHNVLPLKLAGRAVHVTNPQGTITAQAIDEIKKALADNEHVHIIVDGEEDLLTLIAVYYAPENSLIVYGQPNEGLVLVKSTPKKKAEVAKILKAMENASKS